MEIKIKEDYGYTQGSNKKWLVNLGKTDDIGSNALNLGLELEGSGELSCGSIYKVSNQNQVKQKHTPTRKMSEP